MKLKVIEDYRCEGKTIGSIVETLEVEPIIFTNSPAAPHINRVLTELAGMQLGLDNQVRAANPDNPEKWADEVVITIKLK